MMSRSSLIVLATCALCHAVAGVGWAEPAPPPRSNHFFAIQLGGSAVFTLNYRYRVVPQLVIDIGGFGAPECFNSSLGLMSDWWSAGPVIVYTAFGFGAAGCGGGQCEEGDRTCDRAEVLVFGYARLGCGVPFGDSRQHRVMLDAGAWYGERSRDRGDDSVVTRFLIPMGGVGYSYQF